jgi:hypothetical protein
MIEAYIPQTHAKKKTNMRVKKKRVWAPRVRLAPPIYEIKSRGRGKLAAVLLLDVLYVCGVFDFGVVHPGGADSD